MTTRFRITLETLKIHQSESKKLQVKLLSTMMDSCHGKSGMDEVLELARWASALPGLADYVTRMVSAKQETLKMQGMELEVAEDVPMKSVQEMMSLKVVKAAYIPDVPNDPDDEFDNDDEDNENQDEDEGGDNEG